MERVESAKACVDRSCAHPAVEPFAVFLCRVCNVETDSLLGRVVENTGVLYLFRHGPNALRMLMEFWFYFKALCDHRRLPPVMSPEQTAAFEQQLARLVGNPGSSASLSLAAPPSPSFSPQLQQQQRQAGGGASSSSPSSSSSSSSGAAPERRRQRGDDEIDANQQNQQQQAQYRVSPNVISATVPAEVSGAFDDFLGHQMGVIQSCVEAYFSTDWHRQTEVMDSNRQHKEHMERREFLKFLLDSYRQMRAAANSGELQRAQEVLGRIWDDRNRPQGDVSTPVLVPGDRTWFTFELIDAAEFRRITAMPVREQAHLVVFHAVFSVPSTTFVKSTLEPLRERVVRDNLPVRIFIVNASVEMDLLLELQVSLFPTVMLLPSTTAGTDNNSIFVEARASSTADASSAPPAPPNTTTTTATGGGASPSQQQSQHSVTATRALGAASEWRVYPHNGVVTLSVLLPWIGSNGTAPVPERRLKALVTKLVKLEQRLRFAPLRKLHSAANTARRLCAGSGACDILGPPVAATAGGGAAAASPAGAAPSSPQQRHHQQQQQQHQQHQQQRSQQQPRFIFLGGGAASGKSTAVMALRKTDWWLQNSSNIVVVDADEFKREDPLYAAAPADMHEKSVKAAEFLLVRAVNDGRHVIFDSTMMWAPYALQTIDMIRHAHQYLYRLGPGWRGEHEPEVYWEQVAERPASLPRLPYTISLYGIFCDPERSVPRCLVRELVSGRTMPVFVLLKSLKLFAINFEQYVALCDDCMLYDNNFFVDLSKGEIPPVAARKVANQALEILRPASWDMFRRHKELSLRAQSLDTLYEGSS